MPFVVKGRELKDKDVLDPTEMNEDIQPYVELLSGNMDAENINGPYFKANVDVARDAYIKPHYKEIVCHPRFGVIQSSNYAGGVDHPNFANASAETKSTVGNFDDENVHVLPNAAGWVPLAGGVDITATSLPAPEVDFKVTTGATGESNLWINAFVQYVWNGFGFSGDEDDQFAADLDMDTFDPGEPGELAKLDGKVVFVPRLREEAMFPSRGGAHHLSMGFSSARVQFAIRLDGQVLEHTITGKRSDYETSPLGVRHLTTRALEAGAGSSAASKKNLPGPRGFMRRAVGLGPEMIGTRLGTVVRVSPGAHTVEIVARRIAPRGQRTAIQRDRIGVHTRQLSVIEMPLYEGATIASASTSVPAFNSEDTLDLSSHVSEVVAEVNDMKRANIKASSLRNEHLPSTVRASSSKAINPGDTYNWTTAAFPGYSQDGGGVWGPGGNDTIMTAALASGRDGHQGWWKVQDDGGDHFAVNNDTAIDDDSLIIVLADLRVKTINVRTHPDSSYGRLPLENRLLDSFAGFALGYAEDTSGDTKWRIIPGSRAYINSYNWVGRSVHFTIRHDGDKTSSKGRDGRNDPIDESEQPYIEDTWENFNVSLMWVVHGDRLYVENDSTAIGATLRDIKRVGMFASGAASPTGGVGSGPFWEEHPWRADPDGAPDVLANFAINPPKIRWGRGRMSLLHLKR